MAKEFYLEIVTPEKLFFQGDVEAITITSTDGELGIMANHIPMVAPIVRGKILLKTEGKWKEAQIDEGFIEVSPYYTVILTHRINWPGDREMEDAYEEERRENERLKQRRSMKEYHQSKVSLTKAMEKLRVKKNSSPNT